MLFLIVSCACIRTLSHIKLMTYYVLPREQSFYDVLLMTKNYIMQIKIIHTT